MIDQKVVVLHRSLTFHGYLRVAEDNRGTGADLSSAAAIDLAIDAHLAIFDEAPGLRAVINDTGQLQELAKPDHLTGDRNVGGGTHVSSCLSWPPGRPVRGCSLPRARTRSWRPTHRMARVLSRRAFDSSAALRSPDTPPLRHCPDCAEPARARPRGGRRRLGFRVCTNHRAAIATDLQLVRVNEIRWPTVPPSMIRNECRISDSPGGTLGTTRLLPVHCGRYPREGA
jgi:hypothetical protein